MSLPDPFGPGQFSQSIEPNVHEADSAKVAAYSYSAALVPPLSASAPEANGSDPVRDGELVIQETDVDLTGAGIPFQFTRSYRSRVQHYTALGWGWDFNYNRRLVQTTNKCNEIDLLTGDHGRVRFTMAPQADTTSEVVYTPPPGVTFQLVKVIGATSTQTIWKLRDGTPQVWIFDSNGLLKSVQDLSGHGLQFTWHSNGLVTRNVEGARAYRDSRAGSFGDVRWLMRSAEDTRTHKKVFFNYLDSHLLQCLSWDSTCDAQHAMVTFAYKGDRYSDVLDHVVSSDGAGRSYSYDLTNRPETPYLADDVATAFCSSACGDGSDCHQTALCTKPTDECMHNLDAAATAYNGQPEPPVQDIATLDPKWVRYYQGASQLFDGHRVDWLNDPCMAATMYAAGCDWPQSYEWINAPNNQIVSPYCEIHNPVEIPDCAISPGHDFDYLFGPVNTRSGKTLQENQYNHDAAIKSYENEWCRARIACNLAGGDVGTACLRIQQRSLSFCTSSCYDDCRSRYQPRDAQGHPIAVFGGSQDLLFNLLEIHEYPSGRLIQRNTYGTDPADPSFDKVISQQLGEEPLDSTGASNQLSFYYVDLMRNAWEKSGSSGILYAIELAAALPTMTREAAELALEAALGADADTSRLDAVVAIAQNTLAQFVTPTASFQSVYACPVSCAQERPKPVVITPPVIAPPVIQLPPTTPVSTPVVSQPVLGGGITLKTPVAGRLGSTTATQATLAPLAKTTTITAKTSAGTVTLTPTDQLGTFQASGSTAAVAALGTSEKPQVLQLSGSTLTVPAVTQVLPPPPPPDADTRTSCVQWGYQAAWQSTGAATDPQLPTRAVVVADLHGSIRSEYYDAQSRLLREVNHHVVDGKAKETTDYNYDPLTGHVQGTRFPNGQRLCEETNRNGQVSQVTRFPAPGLPGDAQPQMTTLYWADDVSRLPLPLSSVTVDPTGTPAKTSFTWNSGQLTAVVTQVDSTRSTRVQYGYDSAGNARTITRPDGSQVSLDDYGPSGPGSITIGVGTADPVVQKIDYDANGWPQQQGRLGHVLQQKVVKSPGGWPVSLSQTTPTGAWIETTLSSPDTNHHATVVDGPTVRIDAEFDTNGYRRWSVETPKQLGEAARATCWSYAPDGLLLSVLAPEGDLTRYTYDEAKHLVQIESGFPAELPAWAQACVAALTAKNLPTPQLGGHVADLQVVQRLDYDASGFLIRSTDGGGVSTTFVNDGFGRPIEVIAPDGGRLRRGYDSHGRVAWEAAYGPNPPAYARPTALVAGVPLLSMVEYAYDNLDRVTRSDRWHFVGAQPVRPGQLKITTINTYDDEHGTVSTSVDGHPATVVQKDALGRPVSRQLPDGSQETAAWQELANRGDQVTWTLPGPDGKARTLTQLFDDKGQLLQTQDQLQRVLVSQTYDPFWRQESQIAGETASYYGYDSFGQRNYLGEGTGASRRALWSTFDRDGRLRAVQDANKALTTFVYDGLGRQVQVQHPDKQLTSTWHFIDGSARPHDVTDAFGTRRTLTYDLAGRLWTEHVDGAAGLLYPSIERVFTYTALGQLESATIQGNSNNPTNGVAVHLSYDSLGNRIGDQSDAAPLVVSNTWDPAAGPVTQLLQSVTNRARATVSKHYDDRGRLDNVQVNGRQLVALHHEELLGQLAFGTGGALEQPTFDELGRRIGVSVTVAGKAVASLHEVLGLDGVVKKRQHSFAGNQPTMDVFVVDDAGRVTGENLGLPSVALQAQGADPATTFLTNSDVTSYLTDPALRGEGYRTFSLDGLANVLSRSDARGEDKATFQTAPAGWNQYAQFGRDSSGHNGAAWSYTAGHTTQIGTDRYQFDSLGQLVTADVAGHHVVYAYDALGRRVLERDDTAGTSQTLVWDGAEIAATGSGNNPAFYTVRVGDGLDRQLALVDGFGTGDMHYLHTGPDGSVFAATDDAGLLEGYSYSAYGETSFFDRTGKPAPGGSAIGNRWLFQGQLYDPALAAYSMRAREYRPDVARFLSPDPLGIAGGENVYAFVLGRPLSFADPFGLSPIKSALALGSDLREATFNQSILDAVRKLPPGGELEFDTPDLARQFLGQVAPHLVLPDLGGGEIVGVVLGQSRDVSRPRAFVVRFSGTVREHVSPGGLTRETVRSESGLQTPTFDPIDLAGSVVSSPARLSATFLEKEIAEAAARKSEVFFRTMSAAHAAELLATGRLPATAETFISPTRSFAEAYKGVLVQFRALPGTTEQLATIGVRDASGLTAAAYPGLPLVGRGWTAGNAFFKAEGGQINIGLGRGAALDLFNSLIEGFSVIRR